MAPKRKNPVDFKSTRRPTIRLGREELLIEYLDKRMGSHTGSYPELQWFCPFCIDRVGDESTKRKLRLNVVKQRGMCYRCEFKAGRLETLFRALNRGKLLIEEARLIRGEPRAIRRETVRETVLATLYATDASVEDLKPVRLPQEMLDLAKNWEKMHMKRARRYLERRGAGLAEVRRFKIGYCVEGKYSQRLVFPVFQGGEQTYFTTRWCGDSHPCKSLNPSNEDEHYTKETCLLNYDRAIGEPVIEVVEGAFDVMGTPHGIGLMGKKPSPFQVALIEALVEHGLQEAVVCLDADADAYTTYQKLLGRVPIVSWLGLADGDPYDHREHMAELLEDRGAPTLASRVRHTLGMTVKS